MIWFVDCANQKIFIDDMGFALCEMGFVPTFWNGEPSYWKFLCVSGIVMQVAFYKFFSLENASKWFFFYFLYQHIKIIEKH
jgi:hypothetical protein